MNLNSTDIATKSLVRLCNSQRSSSQLHMIGGQMCVKSLLTVACYRLFTHIQNCCFLKDLIGSEWHMERGDISLHVGFVPLCKFSKIAILLPHCMFLFSLSVHIVYSVASLYALVTQLPTHSSKIILFTHSGILTRKDIIVLIRITNRGFVSEVLTSSWLFPLYFMLPENLKRK